MFFSSCDCFFNFVRPWFFVCKYIHIYIYTHVFCTVVRVVHGLRTFNLCHVVTQAWRHFTYSKLPQLCLKCESKGPRSNCHFWDKKTLGSNEKIPGPNKKNHVNKKTPERCFFGEVIVLSYIEYIFWKKQHQDFLRVPICWKSVESSGVFQLSGSLFGWGFPVSTGPWMSRPEVRIKG